jgi:hypothetical protein
MFMNARRSFVKLATAGGIATATAPIMAHSRLDVGVREPGYGAGNYLCEKSRIAAAH